MTTTSIREQIDEVFADAQQMNSQAVERLEQGYSATPRLHSAHGPGED